MSNPNEQRPFFCLAAFPGEERYGTDDIQDVMHHLNLAISDPRRVAQHEMAVESILRNNGFDPNYNKGWEAAGIKAGRSAAINLIQQGYINSVAEIVTALSENVKANPYDYTPATLQRNPLKDAMHSFCRAYQDMPEDYLASDEAWATVGFESARAFQEQIYDIFLRGKVGGYVAEQLNPGSTDVSRNEEYSVKAADALIRDAFPELADKLGIAKDIKDELLPQVSSTMASFDQVAGLLHYRV